MLKQLVIKSVRLALAFYFLLAIGCTLGTVLAFLGQYHWLLDLLSHFRLIYCIFLLPAIVLVWFEKPQRWVAWVFAFALCLNLAQIVPMYFSNVITKPGTVAVEKPVVHILQMNVYAGNDDYTPMIQTIETYKPDIVILEEFLPHHANALRKAGIFKQYPYFIRDLNTINAVLSRYPLKGHMEFAAFGDENPLIVSEINVSKSQKQYPFTLITVHPERATRGPVRAARQIAFFKKVLATVAKYPKNHPIVVAGDYNATPWSYPYHLLTDNTGLYSAEDGFGPMPTFPRYLSRCRIPWPFPLLPIDHVVANQAVHIINRKTLPNMRSDHLPTWTELTFR